jgi:DNA polymerase-3 subunit epsilon/DNA polymerase-3 subunit alpha (Gram-positive type)
MGIFDFLFGGKDVVKKAFDAVDKRHAIEDLVSSIEDDSFVFNKKNKYFGTFDTPKKFELHSVGDDFITPLLRPENKELDYWRFIKHSGTTTIPENYVVFDLETTGLEAQHEEIIEIAAIKFEYDIPIEYFHTYVKPTKKIREKITNLTGITNEDVANAPSIDYVLPNFLEFIGRYTLVAHNAKFDMSFILDNMFDLGYKKLGNKALDTLSLARKYIKDVPNYKLETLKEELCFFDLSSHDALSDAKMTFFVLKECKEKVEMKEIDEEY